MTLVGLEGAINALDTYLEANLAAKVVTLNARYADSYLLEDIKKWYKGSLPIVTPEHPSICIHGTGITLVEGGQRQLSLHTGNRIDVVIFDAGDKVEDRFRRLSRYAIGILELLQAGESSMGYHIELGGNIQMTDVMTTAPFLAGVIVPVTLSNIETY